MKREEQDDKRWIGSPELDMPPFEVDEVTL